MKKKGIIDYVSGKEGMTYAQAKAVVDDVLEVITKALASGNDVELRGFATFRLRTIAGRKGYDFHGGKNIDLPERKGVRVRMCKELLDKLNA